ncbi:hypothetical protein SEVIR_9G426050v4 [Setaria viridis]
MSGNIPLHCTSSGRDRDSSPTPRGLAGAEPVRCAPPRQITSTGIIDGQTGLRRYIPPVRAFLGRAHHHIQSSIPLRPTEDGHHRERTLPCLLVWPRHLSSIGVGRSPISLPHGPRPRLIDGGKAVDDDAARLPGNVAIGRPREKGRRMTPPFRRGVRGGGHPGRMVTAGCRAPAQAARLPLAWLPYH